MKPGAWPGTGSESIQVVPASGQAGDRVVPGWRTAWPVLKDAGAGFFTHQAPTMGAAIAYYTLFSLAPMLLMAIALAGAVFGPEAARGEIFRQLSGLLGSAGAAAVEGLLGSVQRHGQGGWGALMGLVLVLIGATTVFAELQSALDQIWQGTALARGRGPRPPWRILLRARLLALGMVMGLSFLLMVSLLLGAALSALGTWWSDAFRGWQTVAMVVNHVFAASLSVTVFALLLRSLPTVRVPWRHVWVGAVVTASLFTLGRLAIGWYIGTAALDSGFGAAGSLVAVLVWVYFSAQIFLFGAELTRAVAVQEGVA